MSPRNELIETLITVFGDIISEVIGGMFSAFIDSILTPLFAMFAASIGLGG